MDAMAAIRQTFFQECEEQLAELESGLLAMNEGQTDSETVNAVFRAVHSIKGGAGAFKLDALVKFAHTFETALDMVRSEKLSATPDVLKVMLRAADVVSDLVAASRDGSEIDQSSYASIEDDVRGLTQDIDGGHSDEEDVIDFTPTILSFDTEESAAAPAAQAPNEYTIEFKPKAELFANANEPLLVLRELERLGGLKVVCDSSSVPSLEAMDPSQPYLSWKMQLATESDRAAIDEVFEFVEGESELKIECTSPAPAQIRGDIEELLSKLKSEVSNTVVSEEQSAGESDGAVLDEIGMNRAAAAVDVPSSDASSMPAASTNQKGQPVPVAAAPAAQSTIRVEFDRVDKLINLVGELVINQAMISQRVIEANFNGSASIVMGLDDLEQLTREIQESVMAIRAQPVKPLFQRMSRIVRDVADATGKEIRLKTEGEATEIDKTVVERLAEPLTHMIRNAVDHGIEKPSVREALGKPPEGTIRLTAVHRSGRIVIEIEDDGAGINRPKVREQAIAKGLVSPDAQMSDSDIDNLLFLPGFSTASTVSNISGRGVGMDVVKRSIQALGGRISIASRPGKGSTFSLSLPLTLAVLDGMVVSVDGQTFVLPLTAIVETLKPKVENVHGLGADGRVMSVRNMFVPLIDVGNQLGFRTTLTAPESGVAILVESEGGARSALLVDGIQDQRQVVIKSLESNYQPIPGIAAATILGDGRVALILDVEGIVAMSRGENVLTDMRMVAGG